MQTEHAEVTAPVDAPETDVKVAEPGSEGSAPSDAKAVTSEETSDWTEKAQKRYHELTREKYEALGERDRERYQREALEARLAELEKAKTQQVAPDNFPTLESVGFDEPAFHAAVAAHISKVTREQGTAAAQEVIRAEREAEAARKAGESWSAKEAEFIKSKPDYVEKVKQASMVPISKEIQQTLMNHPLGPQLFYEMVEHAEASRAILQLPLDVQLIEVGRIAERIAAAKAAALVKPPVSQAPPPVSKVDAGDAQVEKDPHNMSDAEFSKWRKRQIAQRRNN